MLRRFPAQLVSVVLFLRTVSVPTVLALVSVVRRAMSSPKSTMDLPTRQSANAQERPIPAHVRLENVPVETDAPNKCA